MRNLPTTTITTMFAVMLAGILAVALSGAARTAPSTINDCEKIEAADAYNQCLAMFGPVAHTHGVAVRDFGGDGADIVETANPEASVPHSDRSRGRHRGHERWTGHVHHQYYGHNYSHRHGHSSAEDTHDSTHGETHGGGKKLAFNVVSGHTKKR